MIWIHKVMRGALGSVLVLAAGCNIEWLMDKFDDCQGDGCYDCEYYDCDCYEYGGCYSPECWSDSDCRMSYGNGWSCGFDGFCEYIPQVCENRNDCVAEEGMECDCDEGFCYCYPIYVTCPVPRNACDTSTIIGDECVVFHKADCCETNADCDRYAMNCQEGDIYCTPRTLICDNNRCVEPDPECVADADCPVSRNPCVSNSCVEGQCVLQPNGSCCVEDSDCPVEDGFYCTEGVCYGYVASCEEGICQSHVEPMTLQCVVNADCPSGGACSESICDDGVCVMNPIADCCESDIDCNPMVYADCMAKGGNKCIGAVEAPTQVCRNNRCEPIDVEPECVIASDCPVADDVCMVSDCIEGVCSAHRKDNCCNSASDCDQPDEVGLISVCYEHRCALMVAPECVSNDDCAVSDVCSTATCDAGRCVVTPASDCCEIDDDCPQPDDVNQMMLCRDHRCALFQRVAK